MRNAGTTVIDRITAANAGRTVLRFYCERHPHFVERQWRERIDAGQMTSDGVVLAADSILMEQQTIEYHRPPWDEPEIDTDIGVLYEDDHLAVFDKPDGMPVLPGGQFLENSMLRLVRKRFGGRLAPLHRLGRGTTGAILFTKTPAAAKRLSRDMRQRFIHKTYLALVLGTNMPDEFSIDLPIGRVPHPQLGETHGVSREGKPALSLGSVIARDTGSGISLIKVGIPTGRTHQIRIHLSAYGFPLVGDRFYNGLEFSGFDTGALPGDAGYILHSLKIGFVHPATGEEMEVTAPARSEIREYCSRIAISSDSLL